MSTIITIRTFEVRDFVSVDHGTKAVTLTIFRGQVQAGSPGWSNEIELSPEQAEELGNELIRRAAMVKKPI